MRLDYETELEKIYDQIGPSKTMPLATSSQDRPTVRLMSCIIHERKIYFQTGVDLLKYQQIQENNRVALCADNIQIEGTAKVIGKTKYSRDSEIIEAYKKYHLKSYNTYANSDVEV
ncbi:MAG: pyridoxamine 5'-phosphate oxidase family protein, partial [Bifidobacteriaceae bacterium]|nr:pyridoxamine 5'-phosphate oxidase family protein [Bifidobacteriaceae bacterium]